VVLRAQRRDFRLDAEEFGQEIIDMGRERDQQFAVVLRRQGGGLGAARVEPLLQPGIGLGQEPQERAIDRQQAVAALEIGEGEAIRELQHGSGPQ